MRFVLLLCIFSVIVLAISASVFAQDAPYEGVLTGDRVNLRAGAGLSHKVLAKMKKGAKVTVVGKKQVAGEVWFEVEVPSDVFLYISQRYVQKKGETGEVIPGVVKTEEPGDRVAVRTGTEADDVILGYVNNSDTVKIRGTKDGWYNIVPPKGITAWLHSDYVKRVGAQISPAPTTEDDNAEEQRYREIEKQIRKLEEERDKIKKRLEEKHREEKEIERAIEEIRETERAHEKRMEEIDKRHQAAMERLGREEKQRKRYVAEGIVDDFGKLSNSKRPPAPFRLRVSEDGETRYYLESVDPSVDLRRHLKKRVGVNGEIEKRKWGDREIEVIKVDFIAILED